MTSTVKPDLPHGHQAFLAAMLMLGGTASTGRIAATINEHGLMDMDTNCMWAYINRAMNYEGYSWLRRQFEHLADWVMDDRSSGSRVWWQVSPAAKKSQP